MDYDKLLDELEAEGPEAMPAPTPEAMPAAIREDRRPQMTALSREFCSRSLRPQMHSFSSEFRCIEGMRELMSPAERRMLDADINANGYMTIEQVRSLIKDESVKASMNSRDETFAPDPTVMIVISTRTNYPIFIHGGEAYTREELLAAYPAFGRMKMAPETVFVRQEIGVFPCKKHALPGAEFEYETRDAGDPAEFIMLEDLVGKATKPGYQPKRVALKVITTNIYLGREAWEDFKLVLRFTRSVTNLRLLGGPGVGAAAQLLLMDDSALAAQREQLRRAEEEQAAREKRLREMEERIHADVRRFERLRASAPEAKSASGAPPPSSISLEDLADVS